MKRKAAVLVLGILLLMAMSAPASGQMNSWYDVYQPNQLISMNVKIAKADYDTIQADETFDIEVPAEFWLDNVDPNPGAWNILIRRKSATPIGEKISYRIKFDSKIGAGSARWMNLKSLSLENGDDNDVVSEGLAWYLHRQAWNTNYQPGLAAWVTLTMHVVGAEDAMDIRPQGVYVNVELPDKRFLQNRALWTSKSISWLYKQDDIGLPELKEWPLDSTAPESDSPAYLALAYSPFQKEEVVRKKVQNPSPNDQQLEADLTYWINMESLLRLGAVNAFTGNPDELFNHAKNYFWADFGDTAANHVPRLYFPWDLDAAIRAADASIYGTITGSGKKATISQHPYQKTILNHPSFRNQYNRIMSELLDGPLSVAIVQAFLDDAQQLLTVPLLQDPNNQIGNTPEEIEAHFDNLRAWVAARHTSVRTQLENNGPPAPRE